MGGGKITPVESDDSEQGREPEAGAVESNYLLSAYPEQSRDAAPHKILQVDEAPATAGNQIPPAVAGGGVVIEKATAHGEQRIATAAKESGASGKLSRRTSGKIPPTASSRSIPVSAGDVTINIVKKASGKENIKGTDDEKEDEDEQNDDVERSGESVFDMLGADSSDAMLPFWKQKLLGFVDGVAVSIFMTLLTILVLFLDDMRLACLPPSADEPIVNVTIICLAFFGVELILNSLSKPNYFLGFYFWLDFISTLSLLGDIPDFMEAVTGQKEGAGGVDDSTTLARAGRTSRAGTKAGRIARVMRLIRLVRLVKLYRQFESNKDKKDGDPKKDDDEEEVEQSRVGQKLSDLTTRRVIIGVLGMLFILPLFEVDAGMYGESSALDTGGLEMIHEIAIASGVQSDEFTSALSVFENQVGYELGMRTTSEIFSLSVANNTLQNKTDVERRTSEISVARFSTDECGDQLWETCRVTEAVYDVRWYSQLNAVLNIGRTVFIILVLGVGALLFSKDANVLVLRPLERMIQKVKEISENPLARQAIVQDVNKEDAKLETRVLENSIMKICSLLAVGFGDAGAEVIAENMKKAGALNPMVPGRKMVAIFGFCDIRQFTDTTEILQEEVMEFVNNIARIVHTEVALHGGAANKNIGDAFLLVWKFPRGTRWRDVRQCTISDEDELLRHKSRTESEVLELASYHEPATAATVAPSTAAPSLTSQASMNMSYPSLAFAKLSVEERRQAIQGVADNALAAFVIIHAALKRTADIQKYSARDDLNKRMPNFSVKMGFGLHVGWAIEGAIGSEYKVDASYLSPNVNMASRLEAATKQFGTSILLSSDFVRCLSPQVRAHVRQIDCVTVKGSKQPMGLYTYDISVDKVPEASTSPVSDAKQEDVSDYVSYSRQEYANEWMEHPDLSVCWGLDFPFLERFSKGYDAYTEGRWLDARTILEECRTSRRDIKGEVVIDGPSGTLLDFMGSMEFQVPKDWQGFRELTEK